MKKETEQTPANAFDQALAGSIQGSRHARKLIARFVEALLKTRISNLTRIAAAIESDAETESVYRQLQRFLKNENKVSIDYLKLLKKGGKLKVIVDRTEWKFGAVWVNILSVSVAYRQAAIPVLCRVVNRKGNLAAAEVVAVVKRFVAAFGTQKIERIYADREFGTRELFAFLLEEKIDFHIRLKSSHKSVGRSFRQMWKTVSDRVKLRGKVSIKVFGLEVFVSLVK